MLYMTADGGRVKIIVLETGNLEELKKGRPAVTPDKSVMICYTPDPVWLADKILETDGDAAKIAELIEESLKRSQQPTPRPCYGPHVHDFGAPP